MARIYLDVSCLNRPFDDRRQPRIRLEAEAVAIVMAQIQAELLIHVASEMSVIEINATPNTERQRNVSGMLPPKTDIIPLSAAIFRRANELEIEGLKAADAVHVAAAEAAAADFFLTCDDRLLAACERIRDRLTLRAMNPLKWVYGESDE